MCATFSNRKQKTEAPAIFPSPFTVCSSYKKKFVSVCLRRNKRKLSICRWTKQACPSMVTSEMDALHGNPSANRESFPLLESSHLSLGKPKSGGIAAVR